ncbi:histidinol dehydrogenase [Brevibacterium sp. CBA3109]|uniref:Histidinol dehydrogenase n=1 Tax=Brevibacterium koreense TaxID=3140787 RepID=A0AAU7UMZ8_9MICO
MTTHYLKRAKPSARPDATETTRIVEDMLDQMRSEGEAATRRLSESLDSWNPESFVVDEQEIARAERSLSTTLKDDILFAQSQVRAFAEKQRATLTEFEVETHPGLVVGQRQIPIDAAGCYVPGGRFAHLASAAMSVITAKAAGVRHVTASSPSRDGEGIHPATLYALAQAGADSILSLGGVQAIGAMAFGHFTGEPVSFLAGPGNRFVAEAKRLLYGEVGIDVVAGPTESLVIADDTADPWLVAVDLISQAEHGIESQTILISTSRTVADRVLELIPQALDQLPADSVAQTAWDHLGEIAVVDSREEAARLADEYANEHLQVHAADLDWWLHRLRNYGSLFLGEETTVTYGDKTSGPNHILPTLGGARYTGGLWAGKFVKTVTYQRMTQKANERVGRVAARISRTEGMEGHALAADVRLQKYFPDQPLDSTP